MTRLHGTDELARISSYPPPYPRGWYRLMASRELRAGQVRQVSCLGRQIAVFRASKSGVVGAVDTYCPHLGANLGCGRVCDDSIECPFHRWRFDAQGRVRDIPYSNERPQQALTTSWVVRERYGMIVIWFDPAHQGRGAARPDYEFIDLPVLERPSWRCLGHHDAGRVAMHIIEFSENSVDFQHFGPLHSAMHVPWTRQTIPGIRVHHVVSWMPDPEIPHQAYFRASAVLSFRGRELPRTRADAVITLFGPGGVVLFTFDIPDLGKILMFQTHLPVAPLSQQVDFCWFAERRLPRLLASYVVGSWVAQWANDISIWENKIYRQKPMLVGEDGPVHRLRRWFRQFEPCTGER